MKHIILGSVLLTATILVSVASSDDLTPADLVLINGRIVTVDDSLPEANALAVHADTISAVGTDPEISSYIGEKTVVIDLEGKLATPGFIDSHAHFLSLGYAHMRLDLTKTKNWDDIVAMVADEIPSRQPGEWILGRGWHQDKWDISPEPNIDGLPLHHLLSQVSPDNPVILTHASGHSYIANARAMELAGIDSRTTDPEGGQIIRDEDGTPIGVFRETAGDNLYAALENSLADRTEEEVEQDKRRAIQLAIEECLSKGITGLHDAGTSFETIDLYRRLAQEGRLGIRLWVMISEANDSLTERIDDYRIIGEGNNHLTVRAIKRVIDGALGSHGAWLLEPYSDLLQSTGLNTETIDVMKETARIALEHGFQLCTHAIGDRGNRETLDIYEEAFRSKTTNSDFRWRIEHAQHLHPEDIPRFGELGVIAAMQTVHCTSDGPWVPKRLGDKRSEEGAYVWQKLMRLDAVICNGTDAPVEDVDPIASFYAAVTRKLLDGSFFYPGQKMNREEALRSYTVNAAFAAYEENIKGSLTPGKLADIVILSKDITSIPVEEIPEAQVLYTIVGGKIMYQHSNR